MKFIAIGKDISQAVTTLQRLTNNRTEVVRLVAKNKQVQLHSMMGGRKIMVLLPAAVEKNTDFSIVANTLQGITKNRKGMVFAIEGNTLTANEEKTKYRVDRIPLSPELAGEMLEPGNDDPAEILGGVLAKIIKSCVINSLFDDVQLSLVMQVINKSFIVAIADNFHGALATIELNKKLRKRLGDRWNKQVALPAEYADFVGTHFDASKIHIKTNSKIVRITSPNLYAELPALQTATTPLEIIDLPKKIGSPKFFIESDDLKSVINNINTVKENNIPFILKIKKNDPELEIICKSATGRIRDTIKIKKGLLPNKTLDLSLEANNLMDIVKKLEGKIGVAYNDNICMFTNKHEDVRRYYFSFVLQEPKGKKHG